ncbi:MAG: hypothetical protein M1820_009558 [Bogoriella megaspora]|nr:MAG: hypothetical protein M1820_009558 [Bogoriella megaspora]
MASMQTKDISVAPVAEIDNVAPQPDVKETLNDESWSESPQNPKKWSPARKWAIICFLAVLNLITAMCSSEFEPALPAIMSDLNFRNGSLASFSVSIYTMGYFIGPFIIAPCSELYGRLPVLYAGFVLFMASLAACGASNTLAIFMIFRALMGIAGIAFMLVGSATVADLIPTEKRGLALSMMSFGPVAGPTLSPIIGGFVVEKTSWRWVFWTTLIAVSIFMGKEASLTSNKLGAFLALAVFLMRETYKLVLLVRKQPHRTDSTFEVHQRKEKKAIVANWTRMFQMIYRCPMIPLLALFSAVSTGIAAICFATVGTVFQDEYSFTTGQSGLAYLGLTVGFVFSQCTLGRFSDRYVLKMEARHGLKRPEDRLPPSIIGACLLPVGLLWYGWSLESHTQWIVPIIGSSVIAIGVLYSYLAVQTYLVDAHTTHAASALGACTIIRSLGQTLIPLAANPLYRRIGYGWGNSVFALIAMALVPVAVIIWLFGGRIRTNKRFVLDLQE